MDSSESQHHSAMDPTDSQDRDSTIDSLDSQDHSTVDSSESQDFAMDSSHSQDSAMDSAHSQDSTMESSQNNQSLPPRKRYKSLILPEQEEKDDDDNNNNDNITAKLSTPRKRRHQFAIPKEVKDNSASRTIIAWRKLHEINLLTSILEYYSKNGIYPFDDYTHMKNLYKIWIERGVYMDEDAFNNKLVELPERFFKNQEKTLIFGEKLQAWMPPIDVKIYTLSYMIWGNKDDDGDE